MTFKLASSLYVLCVCVFGVTIYGLLCVCYAHSVTWTRVPQGSTPM